MSNQKNNQYGLPQANPRDITEDNAYLLKDFPTSGFVLLPPPGRFLCEYDDEME